MPDAQTPPQQGDSQTQQPPQPKFTPNGNGHAKTSSEDGHGATKYAPPKSDDKESKPDPAAEQQKKAGNPRRTLILGLVAAVLLVLGLTWGVRYFHYAGTHVGTDDAYITGNLVNVSPIISGTLDKLTVEEGDTVRKGQLIGRLEDSGQLASLRQAQAAYAAARSEIPQAEANLAYEKQATAAAIERAQAGVTAQQAKTFGAQQQASLSGATVRNQVQQAQSQVRVADAQTAGAEAQVETAQAAVDSQRQAVQTAQRAADAATAQIASAAANASKATNDERRYARLVSQSAVTVQQYDAAQAAAVSGTAQLQAAQEQAAQAKSQVAYTRSGVQQALQQLNAARKQRDAVAQQANVSRTALLLAQTNLGQIPIQQSNVANAVGQGSQAQADLANAKAERQQVLLRQRQIQTYIAQANQARASLANAQVVENDTYLYAPTDGQVVKKAVNVGASLSAGQTVATITQANYVWVSANFKETQLGKVLVGQPAEVEVDSFPGIVFSGKVQAVNQATGASIALLPPDNSTGNFTKVVQRVPVRIQLIPASNDADKKYARQQDINRVGQGQSVTATIDTSNYDQQRRQR